MNVYLFFTGRYLNLGVEASFFLQNAVNMSNEYEIATAALFIIYTMSSSLFPDGTISVVGVSIWVFFQISTVPTYMVVHPIVKGRGTDS